jgi:prepilin-type N-terminal cleavage/methylation domain-containing protein
MSNKKYSAFSLIELSIVIVVIGILVAGIMQGFSLVKNFRLQNAVNLTKSSPVNSITNLVGWYETSLEESFDYDESEDDSSISSWNDLNTQSSLKRNAVQVTSANQPLYKNNVFNGALPAVRFDGSNDFLNFDGSPLIGSDYTIFVVEQRRGDGGTLNCFIAGTTRSSSQNLHMGYRGSTTVTLAHYGSDLSYSNAVTAYSSPQPRIFTFRLNSSIGKEIWLNGGTTPDSSTSSQTSHITSYGGSAFGRSVNSSSTFYYIGDLAEIIIYNRALKNEERQSIETYLSKKYNIALN